MKDDLSIQHKIDKLVTSISIEQVMQFISVGIGLFIFAIWIYAALETYAWIIGLEWF